MEKRLPFHQQLRRERMQRGWSQEDLAAKIDVDLKTISRWELGHSRPRPQYLQKIYGLFEKNAEAMGIFEEGIPDDGESLPRDPLQFPINTGETSLNAAMPLTNEAKGPTAMTGYHAEATRPITLQEEWSEIPPVADTYGRKDELALLQSWIVEHRCRVVTILGMGGVGKTTLSAELVRAIRGSFNHSYWCSLHNAPPLEDILTDYLQSLSDHQNVDIPNRIDDQITLLMHYLQAHRCLLVLDNAEMLLQAGRQAGQYREGYESYGRLVRRIGETPHISCLLITSREKPEEIARMEGKTAPVRTLHLAGVEQDAGRDILKEKGLVGTDEDWATLVRLYSGNPLALKLVSETIQEVFGGYIARFLQEGETAFGTIQDLLDQQFHRLSQQEQELLRWLAIEREAVALEEIRENLVQPRAIRAVLETLTSLRRRSMIEARDPALFALQPVIMEYVTARLIEDFVDSFENNTMDAWANYALIKARSRDYVRESQARLILQPVMQRLLAISGREGMQNQLRENLARQRTLHPHQADYLAGNVLNLLLHEQHELRSADFSHLTIRQAYLQNAALPGVNFAHANFVASSFANTSGNVLCVAFHPDGALLASGTTTGEIWLYEVPGGTPLFRYREHTDGAWSVAFSPDGQTLASCSDDLTIRLWDSESGQCRMVMRGHTNRVRALAFSPDGRFLASASEDRTVRLWDTNDGQYLKILQGHTDRIWSLAFSPDGQTLASASTDRTVRLWDLKSGESRNILEGHDAWVLAVAFSPSGRLLASGSDDRTVLLWDAQTGEALMPLRGHNNRVRSLAFNASESMLASASEDHTIRLWDCATGKCLKILQGHTNGVRSVTFSPDGTLLASGGDDQTTRLWDARSGSCLKTFQGHTNRVWAACFSPDGSKLVNCSEDRTIRLWDVDSRICLKTIREQKHGVRTIACSHDGRFLASGGEDRTVRLWDASTGSCLKTLHGHSNWIHSVAFSPDDSLLASGGEDQTIFLWGCATGLCRAALTGHTSWIRSLAFSPDGAILASGGDDQTLRLWEVASGRCLAILREHTRQVRSVLFSPDGYTLASGSEDASILLWDMREDSEESAIKSGHSLLALRGHTSWVRCVAFSPDGSLLASGSDDWSVRLWDYRGGSCLGVLREHTNRVRRVAFSPDGRTLVSSSDDSSMKLWNVQTGACLHTLHNERPYERMDITDVRGLTEAQKSTLYALGAISR